jgi:hypothetical protein
MQVGLRSAAGRYTRATALEVPAGQISQDRDTMKHLEPIPEELASNSGVANEWIRKSGEASELM